MSKRPSDATNSEMSEPVEEDNVVVVVVVSVSVTEKEGEGEGEEGDDEVASLSSDLKPDQ